MIFLICFLIVFIYRDSGHIECVSAGHEIHEWTSWSAKNAIFKDIDKVLAKEKEEDEDDVPKEKVAVAKRENEEL